MILQEPVIFITSHSVVEQILIHCVAEMLSIGQVKGEESLLIQYAGLVKAIRTFGVEVLRRFALYEDGVRSYTEDRVHREQICLAKMLQGSYECLVALQPLIPPSELSGEGRRDKDLVDGCVEAHPFKPFRECLGVLREQLG